MSLKEIDKFLEMCKEEHKQSLENDKNQYIFTYIPKNNNYSKSSNSDDYESKRQSNFRKEKFHSFSDFSALYGKKFKKIEKMFDFFESKKGATWHEERNLPYQKTILLHGPPGTGKSAVAGAIAKKYNLTIVRFNLSNFSTNSEFIDAFKTCKFETGGKEYEYHQLLYLFDEVDTSNDILLDRKLKDESKAQQTKIRSQLLQLMKSKDSSEVSDELFDSDLISTMTTMTKITGKDDLNLGTILEEMSGINQMWGRKMIFITNYPEKLDKAFLREGRIDFNCELSYCETEDILNIIKNFYRSVTKSQIRLLTRFFSNTSKQWTPAQITTLCKNHSSISLLLESIQKSNTN